MRKRLIPSPELIKTIRRRRGWSQQRLADHLELSVKTIGRWERGSRFPRFPEYQTLLRLLPS